MCLVRLSHWVQTVCTMRRHARQEASHCYLLCTYTHHVHLPASLSASRHSPERLKSMNESLSDTLTPGLCNRHIETFYTHNTYTLSLHHTCKYRNNFDAYISFGLNIFYSPKTRTGCGLKCNKSPLLKYQLLKYSPKRENEWMSLFLMAPGLDTGHSVS